MIERVRVAAAVGSTGERTEGSQGQESTGAPPTARDRESLSLSRLLLLLLLVEVMVIPI
jgi:hypothetical protein